MQFRIHPVSTNTRARVPVHVNQVASVAIKSMPWTYRSAILMGLVQFGWSVVAAIAALGSFITLETVTAPDGSSHRAIYCLDNFDLDNLGETSISGESSCSCNGVKISDVRVVCARPRVARLGAC